MLEEIECAMEPASECEMSVCVFIVLKTHTRCAQRRLVQIAFNQTKIKTIWSNLLWNWRAFARSQTAKKIIIVKTSHTTEKWQTKWRRTMSAAEAAAVSVSMGGKIKLFENEIKTLWTHSVWVDRNRTEDTHTHTQGRIAHKHNTNIWSRPRRMQPT